MSTVVSADTNNLYINDESLNGIRAIPLSTGVKPIFGRYIFSVSNGTVSATNLATGNVDYSGTDAAVVINSVLQSLATVGGKLFFQNGIYPINSLIEETNASWVGYYYGIGIPSNPEGSWVQWFFEGEQRPCWLGESGSETIQNNGVIFNVTSEAVASVTTDSVIMGIWQRPDPTYFYTNEIFQKNLGWRFPLNTRGNEIGSAMYASGQIRYDNVNADFDMEYPDIANGDLPVGGTLGSFGLTSSFSSSGNIQHFEGCAVTGYQYGYDCQSEHIVHLDSLSIYCTYAGILGRNHGGVVHPSIFIHTSDQECQNGWVLGESMAQGSSVIFIGYDCEILSDSTAFQRVNNLYETNPGYSYGLCLFKMHGAGMPLPGPYNPWTNGGQNFLTNIAQTGSPPACGGWLNLMGPAPATSSSQGFTGQMATDGTYIYYCTATNTWVRTGAMETF